MLKNFDRNLEKLDRIETDFLRILYYDFGKSYVGNYKSYEYHRLCTIVNGEKKVKINNNDEVIYEKDKFIMLPPNSNVDMIIEKPTRALVFELNNELITSVADKVNYEFKEDIITNTGDFFLGDGNPNFNGTIKKLLQASSENGKDKEFLIDLYAQELTYNLLKMKGVDSILRKDGGNTPLSIVLSYIHANMDKSISVGELARLVNMSESAFSSFFKKNMGICAKDCIKDLKMKKAVELLQKKNVTETALDLGYENISYFIRLFKKTFGITPKQFILSKGLNL